MVEVGGAACGGGRRSQRGLLIVTCARSAPSQSPVSQMRAGRSRTPPRFDSSGSAGDGGDDRGHKQASTSEMGGKNSWLLGLNPDTPSPLQPKNRHTLAPQTTPSALRPAGQPFHEGERPFKTLNQPEGLSQRLSSAPSPYSLPSPNNHPSHPRQTLTRHLSASLCSRRCVCR